MAPRMTSLVTPLVTPRARVAPRMTPRVSRLVVSIRPMKPASHPLICCALQLRLLPQLAQRLRSAHASHFSECSSPQCRLDFDPLGLMPQLDAAARFRNLRTAITSHHWVLCGCFMCRSQPGPPQASWSYQTDATRRMKMSTGG